MYLEQAEVRNFRGIRHLKIDFEEFSTALIGENAWGKTSLLFVLWCLMGRGAQLYQFCREDLYIPPPKPEIKMDLDTGRPVVDFDVEADENGILESTEERRAERLAVDLIFCESTTAEAELSGRLFHDYLYYGRDGFYRLHWRIRAQESAEGFVTRHSLVHGGGRESSSEQAEKAILGLIARNPVLRLREHLPEHEYSGPSQDQTQQEAGKVFESILTGDAPSAPQLREGMLALNALVSRYLSHYREQPVVPDRAKGVVDVVNRPISLEGMSDLRQMLTDPGLNKLKLLTWLLAGAVNYSRGSVNIDWNIARPIVIIEDIESRFHPSLLLSFWSLLEAGAFQKIITTNSGDLLSALPLAALRRLHRSRYEAAVCFKIDENALTLEERRRIAFHVRLNRSMSLFARTWLLVEGETEIWIISQAAAIMGFSLQCDGIRPLEFAQCGLHPLMRMASHLGIKFHVLTDGDEAGQKYAASVRGFLGSQPNRFMSRRHNLHHFLTVLPHIDIEHFLYSNGYADVYLQASGIRGAARRGISADRIIETAIKRKSKPGMAVAVIAEMQNRGPDGVPELFRNMLGDLRELTLRDLI